MSRIFNQKKWLEELDEKGPEKGGKQATKSASQTKLLDNGHGSETSTLRESSLHANVGQTSWKDFSLFEAWFTVKCLENMKWHFNTNAADEIFLVKEITNLFAVLVGYFRFSHDNTAKGFRARIVGICLFQVVIIHCCKLTHTDICQCIIKS